MSLSVIQDSDPWLWFGEVLAVMCQAILSYLRRVIEAFRFPLSGYGDAVDAAYAFDSLSDFHVVVLEGGEGADGVVLLLRMVDLAVAVRPFELLDAIRVCDLAVDLMGKKWS